MHFQNCTQSHIQDFGIHLKKKTHNFPYKEYNIFNTDIDPGGDFMGRDSEETFINVCSGSAFRKPGPGSGLNASYVQMY